MNIKINQSSLNAALSRLQGVAANSARSSLESLKCVKLSFSPPADGGRSLVITGTDIDRFVETTVSCDIDEGSDDCPCLIPYRQLSGIVSSAAPGMVGISASRGKPVVIHTETGRFKFPCIDASEFPSTPGFGGEDSVKVDSLELRRLFSGTRFSVAKSCDARKVLECFLLAFKGETVRCVAANGKSLAMTEAKASADKDAMPVLVPPSTVAEILRLAPRDSSETAIRIVDDGKCAIFDFGGTLLFTRLHDDAYPQYQRVIPNVSNAKMQVCINAALVSGAISRVAAMLVGDRVFYVTCNIKGNTLTVSSDDDTAKEVVEIESPGGGCATIRLDPTMLEHAIESAGTDRLSVYYFGEEAPVVISSAPQYLAVIMPMRVG